MASLKYVEDNDDCKPIAFSTVADRMDRILEPYIMAVRTLVLYTSVLIGSY